MFSFEANRQMMRSAAALACACVLLVPCADAQVRVNPTGVNVNAQGATTVFLTFGGLSHHVPAEAVWCGELIAATPAIGLKCDPATIFGRLPARLLQARPSGVNAFTDIMSIPPSVARRAYQAAADGATSSFFYVRRFVSSNGGPDEYVAVTCRMSGGGARTPLALTDVKLSFDVETPVLYVERGQQLPPFAAEIQFTGTGRLRGRWEIVRPGDVLPDPKDLLTEATLPLEERSTQKRYTEIQRFNVFLPPSQKYLLPGPDAARVPTDVDGAYLILLRVEASDDKEGDSNLAAVAAGSTVVHGGAVAGFPLPALRYVVGGGGTSSLAPARSPRSLELLMPKDGASIDPRGAGIEFGWAEIDRAAFYRLEIETDAGAPVLSALAQRGIGLYRAPPWLASKAGSNKLRWRVIALDHAGWTVERSAWRVLLVSQ